MDNQTGTMWTRRPPSHTRRLNIRPQTTQTSPHTNAHPSATTRVTQNHQNLNKRNSWHHSHREDGQDSLDIYELTRPHADLRRLRSCRSVVAWKGDGLAGGYYTPMLSSKPRRSRSLTLSMANTEESSVYGVKSDGQLHTRKIKQAHPWSTFCGHLEMITAGGYTDSSGKQLFSVKASEAYNKVLKDMKEKSLKKKTAAIIMATRLRKFTENMKSYKSESESDSEEEYEKERAAKRKAAAQRYWGIIRRDVTEKIRRRKERNGASMSWNILRQQVRTKTRAENVRLELYIKYGIIKPTDSQQAVHGIEPIDKPRLSDSAKRLIHEFSNMELNGVESAT